MDVPLNQNSNIGLINDFSVIVTEEKAKHAKN